jgi:restriction system protein
MSRSFLSTLNRIAREAERSSRARARAQEKALKARIRLRIQEDKQAKQDYVESRAAEAFEANAHLSEQLQALRSILSTSLSRDPRIDLRKFLKYPTIKELDADRSLALPDKPILEAFLPKKLGVFSRLIPGTKARHARMIGDAEARYRARQSVYDEVLQRRTVAMAALQAAAEENNRQVLEEEAAVHAGDSEAIKNYFEFVFSASPYPSEFPKNPMAAYDCKSKQLAVDYQLPTMDDVIPTVEKYKYVKSTDEIVETKKSDRQRHSLYADIVAQTSLRCLYEIFAADALGQIEVATLNGFVDTIDPSTGRNVHPYIISVRTTRKEFAGLELRNVDPIACLKRMSAAISRSPAELVPVKPIIELKMVDPRFVEEQDVLSTLDNRPNLMELSPSEFESLITNLFQKMGLETKLTQPSRDGGVDCVAFDSRPILGGKVIVQAKRYKNTVGVSAVRDLFGTIHNEGASKGILVTTSGYGKAAFEFANGKPIELLSGPNLLYLLHEHAGIDAKIVVPDDWVDPGSDITQ